MSDETATRPWKYVTCRRGDCTSRHGMALHVIPSERCLAEEEAGCPCGNTCEGDLAEMQVAVGSVGPLLVRDTS